MKFIFFCSQVHIKSQVVSALREDYCVRSGLLLFTQLQAGQGVSVFATMHMKRTTVNNPLIACSTNAQTLIAEAPHRAGGQAVLCTSDGNRCSGPDRLS